MAGRAHPHPLPATQQPHQHFLHPLQHHRLHSLTAQSSCGPSQDTRSCTPRAPHRTTRVSGLRCAPHWAHSNEHGRATSMTSDRRCAVSQTRNGFKSGAPPSSQEIFYEWSPSPSPPPPASRTGVRNSDSDKEIGFVVSCSETRQSSCSIVGQVISLGQESTNGFRGSIDHPPKREPRQRSRLVFSIQLGIRTAVRAPHRTSLKPHRPDSRSSSTGSTASQSNASARNLPWTRAPPNSETRSATTPKPIVPARLSLPSETQAKRASTPSAVASGPDGKKSVNKIFLSQEQRKVLSMVWTRARTSSSPARQVRENPSASRDHPRAATQAQQEPRRVAVTLHGHRRMQHRRCHHPQLRGHRSGQRAGCTARQQDPQEPQGDRQVVAHAGAHHRRDLHGGPGAAGQARGDRARAPQETQAVRRHPDRDHRRLFPAAARQPWRQRHVCV